MQDGRAFGRCKFQEQHWTWPVDLNGMALERREQGDFVGAIFADELDTRDGSVRAAGARFESECVAKGRARLG